MLRGVDLDVATQPPKPVNPEPEHEHLDPEKGRVEEPEPGKSEHPTQSHAS